MSSISVQAVRFRDVGDLLKAACSSKYALTGASLRWMVLLSSMKRFPQAMVDAVKHMECEYEVRTIESLPQWDFTYQEPFADYKVIAVGLSIGDLRQALDIYTPLKRHVDIWCSWLFRDIDQIGGNPIEITFDVDCCQGLLFTEREEDNIEEHFPLMEFSHNVNDYQFEVELLNDYITVCSECGVVRKREQAFRLLQPNQVALRWTYVPRIPHIKAYVSSGKIVRYGGNEYLLLEDICDRLNTSFELIPQPKEAFGSFNATAKKWVGMVADVSNKEMDFAMSEIACTFPRLIATDCSYIYNIDVITFMSRLAQEKNSLYTMAWTFDLWGWFLIFWSIIAASIMVHLLSSQSPLDPTRKQNPDYLLIIALFLRQNHGGYEEIPTASYRILLFNWAIYGFLVGNSFSGCILAFMNVRLYDQGVNTVSALEIALQNKIYTGGTIRDSFMSAMIDDPMGSKAFTLMKHEIMKKPELLVENLKEGILKSNRMRYAYVDSKTALLSGAVEYRVANRLAPSEDFFTISLTTIHMQKKCFLKPKLNTILSRVVAGGLFEKYLREALGTGRAGGFNGSRGRVLRLKDFAAHFIILGMGAFVATLSFCIRYFCLRARCPNGKQKTPPASPLPTPKTQVLLTATSDVHLTNRSKKKLRLYSFGRHNHHFYQLY